MMIKNLVIVFLLFGIMSLLILISIQISCIIPLYEPSCAWLFHVFHYSTNVLVTMSLICESTRGEKQVRVWGRTRTNILKDKRKENYHPGPQAFHLLFPSAGCPPLSFPSFSNPPVDKMQINVKLSSLSFTALNALMRIHFPSRLWAAFWPPPIIGKGSWGVSVIRKLLRLMLKPCLFIAQHIKRFN